MKDFVIGLDYGTDSARAVLVNAHTGEQIAEAVHNYARCHAASIAMPLRAVSVSTRSTISRL